MSVLQRPPSWATHFGRLMTGDESDYGKIVWLNELEYSYVHNPTVRYELGKHNTRSIGEFTNIQPIHKETLPRPEDSGGSCNYYGVLIENPTTAKEQYTAECNDVIEALDMTYAEANMFKEIWRSAAARTLGKLKAGHSEVRGAEKIEFFAKRNSIQKGVKQ